MTTQAYDGAGNVLGITNDGPASLVSRFAYTYDKANHRLTQAEDDGTVTTWTYDRAYQLLNEDRSGGPSGTGFTHSYAAGASDEYGDLIGGGTEPTHQYDAQANTAALLDNASPFDRRSPPGRERGRCGGRAAGQSRPEKPRLAR